MIDDVISSNAPATATDTAIDAPAHKGRVLSFTHALYGLVILAASYLRLSDLGAIPLAPAEAVEALATWQVLQPGSTTISVGSPAYFSLTSLLMTFLGTSDATARLIPALFGVGLILLPWLLRPYLRPIGALVAAVLLGASPLFSIVSRTAGGGAIALFALLLLLISTLRLQSDGDHRWLYAAAVSLSLGLTASPLFYSGLATLLPAWWIARQVTGRETWQERPSATALRNALIVGSALLVLLSTRFLTYPSALAATAALPGEWLTQFSFSGDLGALIAPALVLSRYELALFVLGIPALIWAVWRNKTLGALLTYWVLTALALILLQRGILNNALLVALPGYLLIGYFAARQIRLPANKWTWAVTGAMLLTAGVALTNITRYLRVTQTGSDLSYLWFAFLALAAGALALYYFWSMSNARVTQGVLCAAIVVLSAYQWGTAWHLTHEAAHDPRERWVGIASDDDLAVLMDTVREISNRASNADTDLQLFSTIEAPSLHWYLRDFWRADFGPVLPLQGDYQAVITPVDASPPAFEADFAGSDFGWLRRESSAPATLSAPVADSLRSWLFHENTTSFTEERLILWVRSDIIQGQP